MKIKIEDKAWINVKCSECRMIIYPKKIIKVRPEGIINNLAEWKFCPKCFNNLFSENERKRVK